METHSDQLIDRTNSKEGFRGWVEFGLQIILNPSGICNKQAKLGLDDRNNDANLTITAARRERLKTNKHEQTVSDLIKQIKEVNMK